VSIGLTIIAGRMQGCSVTVTDPDSFVVGHADTVHVSFPPILGSPAPIS